jgi:hypothetical protein
MAGHVSNPNQVDKRKCFNPRRSPRVTHFCSPKVTHTEISILRRNRSGHAIGTNSIIHAAGVPSATELVLEGNGLLSGVVEMLQILA